MLSSSYDDSQRYHAGFSDKRIKGSTGSTKPGPVGTNGRWLKAAIWCRSVRSTIPSYTIDKKCKANRSEGSSSLRSSVVLSFV